ncbi:MAG: ComF family protein [Actinobacteria bacterium]|nr:ComF family protein [Actinomycetota bacterium]
MILDAFLPASCAGCNQPGEVLCRRCRFSLASLSAQVGDGGVPAALPFSGVARQVVLGLKYRNRRSVARHLARLMVRRVPVGQVHLVTWAPTSAGRARQRGFDQAELLARSIARELGVPCRRLLFRTHGTAQTGHSRAERLRGPSFRARSSRDGLRVLLVDDVVTTGATLAAAKDALLAAGVGEVVCIAAAATPDHAMVGRQSVRPAQRRTVATAGAGSSSTTTASMPTPSAAVTLEGTSSKNAVRPGSAPNLARAS